MKKPFYITTLYCLAMMLITGCRSIPPHENFKAGIHSHIGQRIDAPWISGDGQFPLLSIKTLSNGNTQYRYLESKRVSPGCIVVYEVDPATRVIVNTTFEGTEKSCVYQP